MKHKLSKLLIITSVAAITSLIIMLLWNSIITSVIGWGAVSYLQAAGLLLLCRILFGGISPRALFYRQDIAEQLRGMSRKQKRDYIRDYMTKDTNE